MAWLLNPIYSIAEVHNFYNLTLLFTYLFVYLFIYVSIYLCVMRTLECSVSTLVYCCPLYSLETASLALKLGWQPASPRDHPVHTTYSAGVIGMIDNIWLLT